MAAPIGRPFRTALAATAGMIALGVGETSAQLDDGLRSRLADHQATLRLERELADVLASGDRAALKRFGQGVRRDGGGVVATFMQRAQARDKDALAVYVTLNACHRAGMDMRLTVLAVAEGKVKTVKRGNAFVTRPSGIGEELGGAISICEVVHRMPLSERRIGTNCLHTGQDCQ